MCIKTGSAEEKEPTVSGSFLVPDCLTVVTIPGGKVSAHGHLTFYDITHLSVFLFLTMMLGSNTWVEYTNILGKHSIAEVQTWPLFCYPNCTARLNMLYHWGYCQFKTSKATETAEFTFGGRTKLHLFSLLLLSPIYVCWHYTLLTVGESEKKCIKMEFYQY